MPRPDHARARRAIEKTLSALEGITAGADPVDITRARLTAEAEAAAALAALAPAPRTFLQRFRRAFVILSVGLVALVAALVAAAP